MHFKTRIAFKTAAFAAVLAFFGTASGQAATLDDATIKNTLESVYAKVKGAKRIIAVDTDNKKLDWAREFGATHTINARELDPVETIQDLTDGNGADVVIDAVGRPETWKQAFYARDLAGTVVLVGVPTPDMKLEMPLVDFFSRGGALKSSWYGDCLPERDFPTLISLYLQGRLPLEKFVSERIGLDDIEDAFHKMHAGEVLRSVVVMK